MAIRKVAAMGNPVLRQIAEPVPESEIDSPEIQALIKDMLETMMEYDAPREHAQAENRQRCD